MPAAAIGTLVNAQAALAACLAPIKGLLGLVEVRIAILRLAGLHAQLAFAAESRLIPAMVLPGKQVIK